MSSCGGGGWALIGEASSSLYCCQELRGGGYRTPSGTCIPCHDEYTPLLPYSECGLELLVVDLPFILSSSSGQWTTNGCSQAAVETTAEWGTEELAVSLHPVGCLRRD